MTPRAVWCWGARGKDREEARRPAGISAQPGMDARLSNPVVTDPVSRLRALEY